MNHRNLSDDIAPHEGAEAGAINVTVAWASEAEAHSVALTLPVSSTIDSALAAARDIATQSGMVLPSIETAGIWGRVRARSTRLREGDRIELYRALRADPKDARRARVHAANPRRRGKM